MVLEEMVTRSLPIPTRSHITLNPKMGVNTISTARPIIVTSTDTCSNISFHLLQDVPPNIDTSNNE